MKKVIALIPARSGSKGLEHKNIKPLAGKPLLAWSISACLKAKLIDRTIVSTDSVKYAEIARAFGAECPFLRPKDISKDSSSDLEFVNHAMNMLAKNGDYPDLIVHIRPTTPFRDPVVLDEAITKMLSSEQSTALRSVHEMSETAYKCFEINEQNILTIVGTGSTDLDLANQPRQSYKKTYSANGYVDIVRRNLVQENNKLHGNVVIPFVTEPVVEVDTSEQFELLEFLADKNNSFYRKLFEESSD